ncbi:helix-turn-helix domain-containing protein [Sphingobacterium sp. MYb382]|uniref:helix-turn-helix domain-containing protein n=1 Tax=Sphingobacterium sp. MYb382 TaxID=2745278 RepID=UPI0030A4CA34
MSNIGNNIKKLRKVKGLSQQAFADLFNLTRGNISSYEELRAEPRIEVILKIANYFSIPVNHLLEKNLSVNQILNFNDYFNPNDGKAATGNFAAIPFLNKETLQKDIQVSEILADLPLLNFPLFGKSSFLAIEYHTMIASPNTFNYPEGAILFFEQVQVDNLHTLAEHFGLYIYEADFFIGQYTVADEKIVLELNAWKSKTLTVEESSHYYKLHGVYNRVV